MEEEIRSQLTEAQLALEMQRFARAWEILATLKRTSFTYDLLLDYLYFAGQAKVELQEFEAGRENLLELLTLLEKDPFSDSLHTERVRNWIGISFYRQQYYQQALEQFMRCWEATLGKSISDQHFKLLVINSIASSYLALKNYKNALQTYKEALKLARVGEDDHIRAAAYWGMGMAYRETSKLPSATASLIRCAGIYKRIGPKSLEGRAKSVLGQVLVDRELFDKALEVLKEALGFTSPADFLTLSLIYLNQAYAYFGLGNFEQARESCEISVVNARKQHDNLQLGQGLSQLGRIYWGLGQADQALIYLQEAIEVLKKTEYKVALAKTYMRYSEIAKKLNLFEEAIAALEAAYNC